MIKITIDISGKGKELRKARQAQEISQKTLAGYLGMSPARISELEQDSAGKTTIPLQLLGSLERQLNVELIPFKEIIKEVIKTYEAQP